MEFRFETYNPFNHPQFLGSNASVNSSSFGIITNSGKLPTGGTGSRESVLANLPYLLKGQRHTAVLRAPHVLFSHRIKHQNGFTEQAPPLPTVSRLFSVRETFSPAF